MLKTLNKYKYDILICTAMIAISIIEQVHLNLDLYWRGLKNSHGVFVLFMLFIYEPLKILIILGSTLRNYYGIKHGLNLRRYKITTILTILIFFGSWILPSLIENEYAGSVYFLNGYEKWVNKNVEIDKIQDWLISGEADIYMNKMYSIYYSEDIPEELPDFMKNFKRQYINFNEQKAGREKSIVLEWGGPFGHWGIVIGLPNSNEQQDGATDPAISGASDEYRRSIKPGIYIYRN